MQEIFTKVATHLLNQKSQALINGRCVYRAPDGKMCAVGCLLGDKYKPEMENTNIESIEFDCMGWDSATKTFLYQLVHIHDKINVGLWEESLRNLASKYGLTMPTSCDIM